MYMCMYLYALTFFVAFRKVPTVINADVFVTRIEVTIIVSVGRCWVGSRGGE